MATATKVGRNEPCPCGSGLKYKNCCALKSHRLTRTQIALLAALAVAVAVGAISWIRQARSAGEVPTCPPGQVWSAAHGHCH